MVSAGGQPNYFTINGRAYPSTDTIRMKVGETLKVRFIGTNVCHLWQRIMLRRLPAP